MARIYCGDALKATEQRRRAASFESSLSANPESAFDRQGLARLKPKYLGPNTLPHYVNLKRGHLSWVKNAANALKNKETRKAILTTPAERTREQKDAVKSTLTWFKKGESTPSEMVVWATNIFAHGLAETEGKGPVKNIFKRAQLRGIISDLKKLETRFTKDHDFAVKRIKESGSSV
jgi:hypothetical protein